MEPLLSVCHSVVLRHAGGDVDFEMLLSQTLSYFVLFIDGESSKQSQREHKEWLKNLEYAIIVEIHCTAGQQGKIIVKKNAQYNKSF